MVRKRGNDSVYERQSFKMARTLHAQRVRIGDEAARNSLSNGLLKLYTQTTTSGSKINLSDDTETPISQSKRLDQDETPSELTESEKNKKSGLDQNEKPSKLKRKVKRTLKRAFVPQNSSINLSHVGGVDYLVDDIDNIFDHLDYPEFYEEFNVKPVRTLLIHGPSGCGKSHLVRAIAGEYEMPLIEISAQELVCGVSGESESQIRDIFNTAVSVGRCILFLDNIDAITSKRETATGGMEKRMVAELMKCLDDLDINDPGYNVMVIAATNIPDSIDSSLRSGRRFNRELVIGMPNEDVKHEILKTLFNGLKVAPEVNLAWVAHQAAGYVAGDLVQLKIIICKCRLDRLKKGENFNQPNTSLSKLNKFRAKRLSHRAATGLRIELEDVKLALKQCVPMCKKEGFASVPDVTWEDVGALENVKVELRETMLLPVLLQKYYEQYKLPISKGVLLHGPKGCGKTLIAKALANECNINFLSVNGPELVSMYLGESERAVRKVFERARHSAPCIIFFDEFDALCSSRSNSPSSDATNRVVNQLLTEMDGMQERKLVFVIAATNRLEKIDSAMRRPGRLDNTIYIGLPSPKGRVEILSSLTKNKTLPKIADELSLEKIAFDERCKGFSGADLQYLIVKAITRAMGKIQDMTVKEKQYDKMVELVLTHELVLDWNHFDKAFKVVKPSFNKKDEQVFGQFERENELKRDQELED